MVRNRITQWNFTKKEKKKSKKACNNKTGVRLWQKRSSESLLTKTICNFETVKIKAGPGSPLGSGIKATLPACRTQSNLP